MWRWKQKKKQPNKLATDQCDTNKLQPYIDATDNTADYTPSYTPKPIYSIGSPNESRILKKRAEEENEQQNANIENTSTASCSLSFSFYRAVHGDMFLCYSWAFELILFLICWRSMWAIA